MLEKTMAWAVVGAGPAGVLAVGRLLDAGIAPDEILWLDPSFSVGDFARYWSAVPSNTRVALFEKFLQSTASFQYSECPKALTLAHLNENETCLLSEMVKPLKWITEKLCERVAYQTCTVRSVQTSNGGWWLHTTTDTIFSRQVILCVGAVPKTLHYDVQVNELPLSAALNPVLLKKTVQPNAHIVVFGASHSGVLVMKNCLEAGYRVTNFYRSPLRYALSQEDHIVYDNTGLKGSAAQWAKENLHGQTIPNLTRHLFTEEHAEEVLQFCDHVIYATGFSARHLPSPDLDCRRYDPHTGIIAPGLFGLGIAYPELVIDRYGVCESSIGLFKFSNYLTKVLPLWLRYMN